MVHVLQKMKLLRFCNEKENERTKTKVMKMQMKIYAEYIHESEMKTYYLRHANRKEYEGYTPRAAHESYEMFPPCVQRKHSAPNYVPQREKCAQTMKSVGNKENKKRPQTALRKL